MEKSALLTDRVRVVASAVVLTAALLACAGPSRPASTGQNAPVPQQGRSLAISVRVEPASIAARPLRSTFVKVKTTVRLFNAGLDIVDDHNAAKPYLADALPQLDTDSWRVLPEGQMETSYHLKPNLTWHDGSPLTAGDLVFAWQVYSTPDLATSGSLPFSAIDSVTAPDEATLRIHWRRLYPYAGVLQTTGDTSEFPALPRHILEPAYQAADWDSFGNLPYWTSEFVGAGPYRLDRWEPGVLIDGSAFEGHVLGRPKIDRVHITFVSDANATLANLLSGSIQLAADDSLGFQQGITAKREWASTSGGVMLVTTDLWRAIYFQFRPDGASPAATLDLRVRKALAHAIDKQILNDTLYEGEGMMSETILPPGVDYSATVAQSVTSYPFDVRETDRLMGEAGYRKGPDGFYTTPAEGRFSPELKVNASVQYESERSVVASGWRQAGIDVQEAVLPASQAQDPVLRATFPSMYAFSTGLGERALPNFSSTAIPKPENRWTGNNREAWVNSDYDRLLQAFNTTLDRDERIRQIAQMVGILTDQLPAI